jgi:hypothetical protein
MFGATMPTVTYDGRSFMLDGKRVWLVSGTVPMGRLPREAWAERIHAAKQAGLNTIETPIFWNRHEPRSGRLDFTGENDVRHFVKLVQSAGMYAMLRVGPFVGCGWDLGGLPSWVLDLKEVKIRAGGSAFLDASARYLGALVEQVRDLQVSSAGKGGPVIAVSCEADWSCGDEDVANVYLRELNRFLRESGLSVPIVNSNNLWQSVEGQIDGWAGRDDMLATMRQLSCVRTDQPRMVTGFSVGEQAAWGREPEAPLAPWMAQRRLAEILAGGGQFNLDPFAGGTNTGFWGGRLTESDSAFACATADQNAPLTESGARGASWAMIRRIATFASRFGKTFAGLDPGYQPIALHPGTGKAKWAKRGGEMAPAGRASVGGAAGVIHTMGPQGAVVFVFAVEPSAEAAPATLLLPEGETLQVHTGGQAVTWCLFDSNLNARAHLDYTNLNAFAMVGKVYVCYGPNKTMGAVSINGALLEIGVPAAGAAPTLVEHEGVHVLIVGEDQIDTVFVTDDAVYLGVVGTTPEGTPIVAPGAKSYLHVTSDGVMTTKPAAGPKSVAAQAASGGGGGERVTMGDWVTAGTDEYLTGESARYASIAGPSDLAALGSPFGYGWYRLTMKNTATRKVRASFTHGGDRLHVYVGGKMVGIAGVGPDAQPKVDMPMHKGTDQIVVLADNLGRFAGGAHMTERKGVADHLYEIEAIKPAASKLVRGEPIEVLAFRTPLWNLRPGDSTEPDRVTWTVPHRKKTPVIVHLNGLPVRGLIVVDGKTVCYVDQSGPRTVVLDTEMFTRGSAQVQLAVIGDGRSLTAELVKEIDHAVTFDDAVAPLSAKAEWAFAKWEMPTASAYKPAKGVKSDAPRWWKTSFKPAKTPVPLYLETAGLSKGQVYVNGRHLGRYFASGLDGKAVAGQSRSYIPGSWLKPGVENDLVIFDEHGRSPTKVRLTYDASETPVTAVAGGTPIVG